MTTKTHTPKTVTASNRSQVATPFDTMVWVKRMKRTIILVGLLGVGCGGPKDQAEGSTDFVASYYIAACPGGPLAGCANSYGNPDESQLQVLRSSGWNFAAKCPTVMCDGDGGTPSRAMGECVLHGNGEVFYDALCGAKPSEQCADSLRTTCLNNGGAWRAY